MTQIDIAALVADLTEAADQRARATAHDDPNNYLTVVAAVSHADAVRMQSAASALIAQDAELKRLREALAEAKETLVEVKREMWRNAARHWILSDFLNWAIVQRITAATAAARAALGEKP